MLFYGRGIVSWTQENTREIYNDSHRNWEFLWFNMYRCCCFQRYFYDTIKFVGGKGSNWSFCRTVHGFQSQLKQSLKQFEAISKLFQKYKILTNSFFLIQKFWWFCFWLNFFLQFSSLKLRESKMRRLLNMKENF